MVTLNGKEEDKLDFQIQKKLKGCSFQMISGLLGKSEQTRFEPQKLLFHDFEC